MQTTVIFKADKKLKQAAQKAAKNMGIPFSAVMNQYMRKFVEEQEIAFSAKYYNPTPYLRRILDQQEKDFKTGKNIKTYNSLQEPIALMGTDEFNPLLNNHKLHHPYLGCSSINITGDWRLVYRKIDAECYQLRAVGTHHQLFGT